MFAQDQDTSSHLTTRLVNALRQSIRDGRYAAGQLIPSERELSEQMGVSRTTVRRAIQLLVDEGVLFRVPGSGTFVGQGANSVAALPALGLIVPSFANPFFGELAEAIEQAALASGYEFMAGQSDFARTNEASYLLRYADNPGVKGVLVVPTTEELPVEAYQHLTRHHKPFLFVARPSYALAADIVSTDHVAGAAEVVRYLLQLGHRRIAYIGHARVQPSYHLLGYRQALREAGLPEEPDLIVEIDTTPEEAGTAGVELLLRRGTPFTAIFAKIDVTAFSVIRALRDAGRRVPDDISVAGFDDTPVASMFEPPLTTVSHTPRELGRLAVSLLLDRVAGRYSGPARQVIIRPHLVIRGSCRAPLAAPPA